MSRIDLLALEEHRLHEAVKAARGSIEEKAQQLVVDGRGLFDTCSGARVARDNEQPTSSAGWSDESTHTVAGIGELAAMQVSVVGLWGGHLSQATEDGWRVTVQRTREAERVVLSGPGGTTGCVIDEPITELRAVGFSTSGRFLICATSSEISLLRRAG